MIDLVYPNGLKNTLKIIVVTCVLVDPRVLSKDLGFLLQCHTVKQKAAAVDLMFPNAPML